MSAIDFSEGLRHGRIASDFIAALGAGWRELIRRRRERQTMIAISRLPRHVISDIGFEPERVYEAVKGTWDEVDPVDFRILLPTDRRI